MSHQTGALSGHIISALLGWTMVILASRAAPPQSSDEETFIPRLMLLILLVLFSITTSLYAAFTIWKCLRRRNTADTELEAPEGAIEESFE